MNSLFSTPDSSFFSSLYRQFPFREQQISTLAILLSTRAAPCRNIILHGLEATGKTSVASSLLDLLCRPARATKKSDVDESIAYAIISSAECITGRHLLERALYEVAKAVRWKNASPRCENMAQLAAELGKALEGWLANSEAKRRFVLVFDGIDRQREAPPTLLQGLARLSEIVPCLTTVFIITIPRPSLLNLPGVPNIEFTTYTKPELLQIISLTDPEAQLPGGPAETKEVWTRFCATVWDSLAKHSGRDILSFQAVCSRLWPAFIAPILDGTYAANQFSRLVVANRSLFQNDTVMVPSIIAQVPGQASKPTSQPLPTASQAGQSLSIQLPYFSRLLLVASYLASYNPPRTDQLLFMKTATGRKRKRGGGTRAPRKSASGALTNRHRKISRKLLGPQSFTLERMMAIFHAIRDDATSEAKLSSNARGTTSADIQMGIATLTSLRLLRRLGGAASGGDGLDGGTRWRVAVGWEVIRGIARGVGIEVEDYIME